MTDSSRVLLVAPVRRRGMGVQDPIEAAEHALPFLISASSVISLRTTLTPTALPTLASAHSTKNRIATLTHSDTCKLRRITMARSSCLHAYYSTRETSMSALAILQTQFSWLMNKEQALHLHQPFPLPAGNLGCSESYLRLIAE
jgi:hypothetical protein